MTLQQFQDYLHAKYQGDTSTPSSSEEDWDVRLYLLYDAIDAWDGFEGTLWAELWIMLQDAAVLTGDKTTDGTNKVFDCPEDFRFIGGAVILTDGNGQESKYDVITPQQAHLYYGQSGKVCWITGNKSSGFKLNFLTVPTTGQSIDYPYYKEPSKPSSTGDIIEMSDPWFTIDHVLSKLHELDGEGDRAGLALAKAGGKLSQMKTRNVMPSFFQQNKIPEHDTDVDGTMSFGQ